MDKHNFLDKVFPAIELGNNRSLFEEDFYDTHYRYFDQVDDAYLNALDISPENLILKWGFDWPEFYIKIGIEAVKARSRPYEGINRWQDVTYEYLYYFSDSCCCLSSAGFKFFLPAALFHYLNRQDRNNTFIDYFLSRLDNKWDKDSHIFNDIQKDFIIKLIKEHFNGEVGWASL